MRQGFRRRLKTRRTLWLCVASRASWNASHHLTLVEGASAFPQLRFARIATDVANTVREVILMAREAVEVILLPERATRAEHFFDLPCAVPLLTVHHVFQRPRRVQDKQHLDMNRHDDPSNIGATFAIEIPERIVDMGAACWLTQRGRTMSLVQPSLRRTGEAAKIFLLDFHAPWLWMMREPCFAFGRPLIEQMLRNSSARRNARKYTAPSCCQCGRRFAVTSLSAKGLKNHRSRKSMRRLNTRNRDRQSAPQSMESSIPSRARTQLGNLPWHSSSICSRNSSSCSGS